MIIESIDLQNYRNYQKLHMELDGGTNILYGNNAQGKTNILEAIYVCCTSKSHRSVRACTLEAHHPGDFIIWSMRL